MQSNRNRRPLAFGVLLLAFGLFLLLGTDSPSVARAVLAGAALALGGGVILRWLKPMPAPGPAIDAPLGDRLTDTREHPRADFEVAFATALRGYDKRQVDELVGLGQSALATDVPTQCRVARTQLDTARAALPIALRGYDIAEVDAYLERLSAALAGDEPG
ncbi:hypothetical protein GCM10011608_02240 [Micromonospora sonchi]|uniref:DivIVA domain-containing protein n=1 Tax=Micromonospora sonchi TaxID=1763543 RepID=A0A917TG58_9ACTN|nr:DivIVA domain-containing protein [Micromonospora sonchi]GGM21153.1 hypothetical protein GCM10011608_02240 [Micromonospora sonchi]